MNGTVNEIKKSLVDYFVEERRGVDMTFELRVRFGSYGLEFAPNGEIEVDRNYLDKYPYLLSYNKDESELVMIVFNASKTEGDFNFSLYCVRRDVIYEFRTNEGKKSIPLIKFKDLAGTLMIQSMIEFNKGARPENLVPTNQGIGFDIINFKRSFN